MRGEIGGRKLDFGRKRPGGAWQKAALQPERYEKGWCSRRLTGRPGCGVQCLMPRISMLLGAKTFVGLLSMPCYTTLLDERSST